MAKKAAKKVKKAKKIVKKKLVKKPARAAAKKSVSAKKLRPKKKATKKPMAKKKVTKKVSVKGASNITSKPSAKVTHFYSHISVAIIKVLKGSEIKVGETIHFKGHTTDFKQPISSMQYFHKPIAKAKPGQEIGIKVKGKTREGDKVFKIK